MRKNKNMLLMVVLLITAISISSISVAAKDVVRIGLTTDPEHPYALGMQYFFEELNKETGNRFELHLYPNNQLGGERELVESVQLGTLKMSITSAGPLSSFAPSIKVFDLPFLFRDSEHAYRVLDGPIGQEILKEFEDNNLIALAYWESGWRHLTNNKRSVKSPQDMRGLKIRVMESPVMVSSLNNMGGQAVPMSWAEVLTALQQGVLDGQENPLVVIWGQGVYDVQKYLSLTGHFYTPAVLLVNKRYFESLPKDVQEAMRRVAIKAAAYERELCRQREEADLKELGKTGMIITYPSEIDFDAFEKSVQPVYEQFAAEVGGMEFINRIKEY